MLLRQDFLAESASQRLRAATCHSDNMHACWADSASCSDPSAEIRQDGPTCSHSQFPNPVVAQLLLCLRQRVLALKGTEQCLDSIARAPRAMQLHTPGLHGSHATYIQCPGDILRISPGWIAHPRLNTYRCNQQCHMQANSSLHDACM